MKYGRLSGKDLEEVATRMKKALSRKSTHSCAFMVAPFLVSERTSNGLRGELRTVVCKWFHNIHRRYYHHQYHYKCIMIKDNIYVLILMRIILEWLCMIPGGHKKYEWVASKHIKSYLLLSLPINSKQWLKGTILRYLFKPLNQWHHGWLGNSSLYRKIEDKMDAKSLQSFTCSIRCCPPPQQKKVPIHYNAWIVVADSTVENNVFLKSQLYQDRTGFHQLVFWCCCLNSIYCMECLNGY